MLTQRSANIFHSSVIPLTYRIFIGHIFSSISNNMSPLLSALLGYRHCVSVSHIDHAPIKLRIRCKGGWCVFWVIALCNLIELYRGMRGACRLYHQGDGLMMEAEKPLKGQCMSAGLRRATAQKKAIFIVAALRTWNFTFWALFIFVTHCNFQQTLNVSFLLPPLVLALFLTPVFCRIHT